MEKEIRDIVKPGSSLGGARPKASVIDTGYRLKVAKFPDLKDGWDSVEAVPLCHQVIDLQPERTQPGEC